MDLILKKADEAFFTPFVFSSDWPEDDIRRQFLTLYFIVTLFGYIFYFLTAGLNYMFIFDHSLMNHPLFLKNQVQREISSAVSSIPFMGFLTAVCFLFEVRGFSKLYDDVNQVSLGWGFIPISILWFLMFTDTTIYWVHRWLHCKYPYKYLHKPHHTWKIPTPFAGYAFHPLDGFLQSLPYHVYIFLFPLHKLLFLALFIFVNVWSISIHDCCFGVPKLLQPVINGAAHHFDHHLLYNYNYGQYFTLWDRILGTFKEPQWEKEDIKKIRSKNYKS